jgi:serine/threonine protein kinase
VRCYDVVHASDPIAIILEYLEGESLDAEMHRMGPITGTTAAAIALVLADALDYLEKRQIV